MATATPHLFNSTPFAVIAELLYRRTGLLVTADQVETTLVSAPGIESVTNGLIGYGDGATTLFAPLIHNVPIMNSFAVSAVRVTTVDGTTSTLDVSTYTVDPTGSVTLTTAPAKRAKVYADYQGVPQAYIAFTAKTTLPDLSRGPFVGTLRLGIDRLGVDSQILATLVYSDAFPPTCDDFITYLSNHYDYTLEDGEFFVVGDSTRTPIVRGGGQMQATLDDNRQFKLEATASATRWTPGSQILFQQQSLQSIVPPGQFAFTGTLPDGALGEPYNYTFQTINGTAPITFSVISGIPPAAINTSTGAMHVDNFDTLATYSWVIEATDADGRVVTENCILKVEVSQLQAYPSTHTPSWTVGTPISLAFNPYGGQRPYTYTVTGGSLLPGLSFVGDTLQGMVDGNPSTSNTLLQSIFTVTLTDNRNQTVVMNFNATVTDRSETIIKASLCTKVVNWWDAFHSTASSVLATGSTLYDGTDRMNLTVGGSDLTIEATGRSGIPTALNFNASSYATALTTAYNLSNNFTLVSLVNLPSASAVVEGQVLFGRGGDSNGGYALGIGTGGNTLALDLDIAGTPTTTAFTTTLPQGSGNWSMVMVERYQGTPSLILNAGSIESDTAATGLLTANNSHYFTLGADTAQSAASLFGGASAMNAVFNDKLWSDERKWLWNGGSLKPFYMTGFWPALTFNYTSLPNEAVLALDDTISYEFTLSGGTGRYWGIEATPGYPLPPGLTVGFDGVKTVTLGGAPTEVGTFVISLRARSTDGSVTVFEIPNVQVATLITPLVDLPMSGNDGSTAVIDSTGRVWTVNGNAVIKTDVDANGAMYFDGSNNSYLSTPFTHDMDLVGRSFTAQIDIYSINTTGIVATTSSASPVSEVLVPLSIGGTTSNDQSPFGGTGLYPRWGWFSPNADSPGTGFSYLATGSVAMVQNGWNTVKGIYNAASRVITLFLNGQVCAKKTLDEDTLHPVVNPSDNLLLGAARFSDDPALTGYLRNFQWSAGLDYDVLGLRESTFGPYVPNVYASYSVAILGGDGTYTATLVEGNSLPDGLTLSVGNGVLTLAGVTTVDHGSYTTTIQVTSGDGQVASFGCGIIVDYSLLSFSPSVLPAAQVGQGYSQVLTLSGGDGTYSAAFLSGTALPDGLSGTLDGNTYTVSGTPTSTGSSQLQIQFTSGDGQSLVLTQTFQVVGNFTILDAGNTTSASSIIFSPDNLTASQTGYSAAGATTLPGSSKTSAKWYFEVTRLDAQMAQIFSIALMEQSMASNLAVHQVANYPYFTVSGDGGYFLNNVYHGGGGPAISQGTVVGVAVDTTSGNVWVRNNGTGWVGGGSPSSGTAAFGTISSAYMTGGLMPALSLFELGVSATCNFGQNAFTYPVPLGFFPGWTNSVSDAVTYPALTVSGSFATGIIGQPYSQSLFCVGGTGIYAASVTAGTLPDGLTASFTIAQVGGQSKGAFTVNGVPASTASSQTFTVTFLSTDGQSVAMPLSINVGTVTEGTYFDGLRTVEGASLTNEATTLTDGSVNSDHANSRTASSIAGKRYFSYTVSAGGDTGVVYAAGVSDESVNTTLSTMDLASTGLGFYGPDGNAAGGGLWLNGTQLATTDELDQGQIEVAVDASTRHVWVRPGGGQWIGGGDPGAGTNPTATLTGTGALYPTAVVAGGSNGLISIQTTSETVTGPAPSGFNTGLPLRMEWDYWRSRNAAMSGYNTLFTTTTSSGVALMKPTRASGKWYIEIISQTLAGANAFIGLADDSSDLATLLGSPPGSSPLNSVALRNDGQWLASTSLGGTNTTGGTAWAVGSTVTLAVDLTTSPGTIAVYVNGTVANDSSGNPLTAQLPIGGNWAPIVFDYNVNAYSFHASPVYPLDGYDYWVTGDQA